MFFEDSELGSHKKKGKNLSKMVPLERINRNPPMMTDAELMATPMGTPFVFDVESYPNYFCVTFTCVASGKSVAFEDSPESTVDGLKLSFMLHAFCCIGFNSLSYDIAIVALACYGYRAADLYKATLQIIQDEMRATDIEKHWNIEIPCKINHVDLIEVAPLSGSLKLYAARLHCQRIQDLPFPVGTVLSQEQAQNVLLYNINDNDNTVLLYKELLAHIQLREEMGQVYGQDLRSLSDAQIAEAVICKELAKLQGFYPRRPKLPEGLTFQYQVPEFISFRTPVLQAALEVVRAAVFVMGANGSPLLPDAIAALTLPVGASVYQMGRGGLHSTEESSGHVADEETMLIDRDVASYYPRIILNQRLYPKHLGPAFLDVFEQLVNKRLAAKKAKDSVTADALKITINGTFGKLGDKYSAIYAPDLLTQVTMSGQLCLLMLIEMIELAGIPVVSGNTDGIIIKCPVSRYDDLNAVIAEWERVTQFETEETRYAAVYSRDVNNYIAVKYKQDKATKEWTKEIDGCKLKGVYAELGSALNSVLSKNPETLICSDAVQAFITKGTPIEQTVTACRDIRRFVSIKNVRGGGHKDGVYLGKVVRWYYAVGVSGQINYVESENAVAKSTGAKPLMDLPPEFPTDINYDWYINEANQMLYDIGFYKKRQAALF